AEKPVEISLPFLLKEAPDQPVVQVLERHVAPCSRIQGARLTVLECPGELQILQREARAGEGTSYLDIEAPVATEAARLEECQPAEQFELRDRGLPAQGPARQSLDAGDIDADRRPPCHGMAAARLHHARSSGAEHEFASRDHDSPLLKPIVAGQARESRRGSGA